MKNNISQHSKTTIALAFFSLTSIVVLSALLLIDIFEDKSTSLTKSNKKIQVIKNLPMNMPREQEDKVPKPQEREILEPQERKIQIIRKRPVGASHEYEAKIPKPQKRKIQVFQNKPRLIIIIDDVAVKSQVKAIKSLNIPLTMSFLPPNKHQPNSAKLAKKEKVFLVHLPLEAMNCNSIEAKTLQEDSTKKDMLKRILEIKKLFPTMKYVNNHMGSKFTASELAMNKLMYILNQQNIKFIDSRTTSKTKVPLVMKNLGKKYIARDIFLDHIQKKSYVKKQIKAAVKMAKKYGTVVAIGHPHKNTLQALRESRKLLKNVNLVLVDKLY